MHRIIASGVVGGALTLVLFINGVVESWFAAWVATIALVAALCVWAGDKYRWPISFMAFSIGVLFMVTGWAMSFHDWPLLLFAPITIIGAGIVATNIARAIFALLTISWRDN